MLGIYWYVHIEENILIFKPWIAAAWWVTGDFPAPQRYAEILQSYDLTQFPKLDKSALAAIDGALSIDIPNLVAKFDNPYAWSGQSRLLNRLLYH